MTTTNISQSPDTQARQPGNRPVVETLEKYRWDILNTISSNAGSNRGSAQNSLEFLNALNSLITANTEFTNILRWMGIANYATTIAQLRREVAWNNPNIRFEDLPGHNDVQVIIAALAEYRRHQAREEQNNFDAIYLWQTGETESSTAQQIESAAQRARLSWGALYYRNKTPLRISWNNAANQFEAQYLDTNGQPTNLTWITAADIPTLVTEINTRSQRINKIKSDNVQENVEIRESKKADHKQIIAAIDFVNRGQTPHERESRTWFYSVDSRNIAIRGEGAGAFSVDIMQPDGSIVTRSNVAQNAVTGIIDAACSAYEKSKERKETIETPDMWTQFDEAIFKKLCRDVSNSKDKVATYKLSGQKYTLREVQAEVTWNNPSPARYVTQFPNPQGRTENYPNPANNWETGSNIATHLTNTIRTSINAGNCTRDMGTEFSANTFRELCEEIAESKNGRGNYILAGKKYEVRIDQPLPTDISQAHFHVEYPNNFGIKAHAHNTLDWLLTNHGPLEHIHVHDPSKPHPFQKDTILELCQLVNNTNQRQEFDFHGKSCFIYKPTGLDKANSRFCIDVPNNKWGVDTIKAVTAKWLYKKFIEHTHKLHHEAEHNSKEHAEKKGENKNEHAEWEKHGHDDHGHKDEHKSGSFYDRAVEKILGNGLLGKILIWPKNQIPKPLRSLGGNTVAAWVTWGAVGGAVALAWWIAWSAALSSAVVPAIWITFTASMANRFLKWRKWWPHNKDGKWDDHWHGWH